MTVHIAERPGHLWLHDRTDHLDHAMPRRHLIDATRRQADTCRAACGHLVYVQRCTLTTGKQCGDCAERASRPSLWHRLLGATS